MEKKMNALGDNVELFFPIEIIFEILSWMTVASLLRCKCVCKQWNEIIQHPKFIQMHMTRSKEKCTYDFSKSLLFLNRKDGLLVEKSTSSGKYHVRNPATKQILDVPNPNVNTCFMIIFPIASTNSYKLVNIYKGESVNRNIGFKVLSFEGSDLSWRDLANSPSFCEIDITRQKISTVIDSGLIYVFGLYEDGSKDSQIHFLDVETEILTDSPIFVPRSFFPNWKNVKMIKWEMKVVLMNLVEEELNIFVLEDPKKKKWAEKKIVIPLTFLKENPAMKENLVPLSASSQHIRFKKDDTHIIDYFIGSKQMMKSQYSPIIKNCIVTHSLTTLKGMQPMKEQKDEVEGG